MADYNLGTAKGVIEIEYKGDGAKQAQQDLGKTSKAAKGSGNELNSAANKAGVAGFVIAGGFALAAKTAGDFEAKMSGIAAVSGASEAQLEQLRSKSLQLGKDTQFSASESASAIEELIKAGISVEDVMAGAADATVALAAAGGVDMPTAATIASNAMNQFNLTADDMTNVVDKIAGAANGSAIDVTDLGQSMSQVGAVANLAGLNFEDTATAIAEMGNAGIKGSDAGTSLKSMLMNLQPETDKQIGLMKDLGLMTKDGSNLFYDQEGRLKSLRDIQGILAKSTAGMTKEQKQMALQTLFGSDGIRAAAILADEGAKGYDKMSESMSKVSAADVAAKRMDNFNGSMEQLKGSLETAGIVVGTLLIPALREVVDNVTGMLNWFLNLDGTTRTIIVALTALVGVFLLIVFAIVKAVQVAKTLKATLIALRAAMALTWVAALGPIALVIAAVAAIVAIIILLWKKNETFRNIVLKIWDAIKRAVSAVADWFSGTLVPMLKGAWDAIAKGLQKLAEWFKSAWDKISAVVEFVFTVIKTIITTYIKIWTTVIRTALKVIMAVWEGFWKVFGGLIKAVWGLIIAVLKLAWTIIKGLFLVWLNVLKAVWTTVWNAILTVIRFVWGIIVGVVRTYIAIVRTVITTVLGVIRAIFSRVWNGILNIVRFVWDRIGGKVMAAVNLVKQLISNAWNAIKTKTSEIWNGLKGIISGAWDKISGFISTIKEKVTGFFTGAGTWLIDAGKKIIQGLIDGITSMIGKVTEGITKVTDKIAEFLPGSPVREGPLKVLNRGYTGKKISEMVADGVTAGSPEVQRAINTLVSVPDIAGSMSKVGAAGATTFASAGAASSGLSGRSGTVAQPSRTKLLEGSLRLDKSGRAYITGVAEDVYDGNDKFAAAHGRMG